MFSPAFKIFKRFKGEGGKTLKDQFVVKGAIINGDGRKGSVSSRFYLLMERIRITFPEFFAKSWEVL